MLNFLVVPTYNGRVRVWPDYDTKRLCGINVADPGAVPGGSTIIRNLAKVERRILMGPK